MSSRATAEIERYLYARHENAAGEDEPTCSANDDGFVCTRKSGHPDDAEAHGMMATVAHRWPANAAEPAAA